MTTAITVQYLYTSSSLTTQSAGEPCPTIHDRNRTTKVFKINPKAKEVELLYDVVLIPYKYGTGLLGRDIRGELTVLVERDKGGWVPKVMTLSFLNYAITVNVDIEKARKQFFSQFLLYWTFEIPSKYVIEINEDKATIGKWEDVHNVRGPCVKVWAIARYFSGEIVHDDGVVDKIYMLLMSMWMEVDKRSKIPVIFFTAQHGYPWYEKGFSFAGFNGSLKGWRNIELEEGS